MEFSSVPSKQCGVCVCSVVNVTFCSRIRYLFHKVCVTMTLADVDFFFLDRKYKQQIVITLKGTLGKQLVNRSLLKW